MEQEYKPSHLDCKKTLNELISKLHEATKVSAPDNFIYYEFEDGNNINDFLAKLALKGYIFHGTSRRINENLKPHQANDDVKESGNRNAVYFTQSPLVALFCAVAGGLEGIQYRRNAIRWSLTDNAEAIYEDVTLEVDNPQNLAEEGYIYISHRSLVNTDGTNLFNYENSEFIADTEVEPMLVIKVRSSFIPYPIGKSSKKP